MGTKAESGSRTPSSQTSSLSPPPSSLSDAFEDPPLTGSNDSRHSEGAQKDESGHEVTLEPASLPKNIEQTMVMTTRRQRKAREQANITDPPTASTARGVDATLVEDSRSQESLPKTTFTGAIVKKAPPRKKKWTAEKLLSDPKSPLAKADIRDILARPEAWDVLTPDEKKEILALMPPGFDVLDADTDNARPNMATMCSDDNFRHDCATYRQNLADGKHDPAWLAEAWAAHEQRRAGEFDEYLKAKFEEDWGIKLPDEDALSRNGPDAAVKSSTDDNDSNVDLRHERKSSLSKESAVGETDRESHEVTTKGATAPDGNDEDMKD